MGEHVKIFAWETRAFDHTGELTVKGGRFDGGHRDKHGEPLGKQH
jgi:hypothetical protein